MICSIRSTRAGGISLLAWAAALGACSTQTSETNNLQREDAERQAVIEAMKNHPAFDEGASGNAVGNGIDVPVTVPPKAENGDDHPDHPPA